MNRRQRSAGGGRRRGQARLEDLSRGTQVAGVLPGGLVTVVDMNMSGQAGTMAQEVVQHSAGLMGADVQITLET